ncbi:hypothetical protein [Candidatus Phytoplasma pyri]|uniref:hypothetical protein n=1 Tax=Candidatus Phytoplasma pyri TaxID=47566 RepID=UPI003983749A
MVKNNKKIIKQIIIILLLTLPLIIIISVSGTLMANYQRMLKANIEITKRPPVSERKKDSEFIIKETDESTHSIGWENHGKTSLNTNEGTILFVEDYPKLKNDGKFTKVYEIQLADHVRAQTSLNVVLDNITQFKIMKKNSQDSTTEMQEEDCQYLEILNHTWEFSENNGQTFTVTNSIQQDSNSQQIGLIQGGATKLQGENKVFSKEDVQRNSSLYEKFKDQYKKSRKIKLKIEFKIDEALMENSGVWNEKSPFLTEQKSIKLLAAINLHTKEAVEGTFK